MHGEDHAVLSLRDAARILLLGAESSFQNVVFRALRQGNRLAVGIGAIEIRRRDRRQLEAELRCGIGKRHAAGERVIDLVAELFELVDAFLLRQLGLDLRLRLLISLRRWRLDLRDARQ